MAGTPLGITDATLRHAAKYRAGGRFPILSYAHHPNGAVLFRMLKVSQRLQRNRSVQDDVWWNPYVSWLPLGN